MDFELDAAGDGDKFKGFFRRQGDPTAVLREAENKRLEDRLINHDIKRNVNIFDTLNVSTNDDNNYCLDTNNNILTTV